MKASIKLKHCLFLLLFGSAAAAAAGTSQTKILQISARLNNEDFFDYQVTKFGFDESHIIVDYNRNAEQFYAESTDIILETDIPVGFSASFEMIAKELSSTCENSAGETVQKDFATYWLDGEELVLDSPHHFDSFNNPSSVYLKDKRDFTVSFDALPSFEPNEAYCKGSATLLVSLDF